jgi:hypothetical protein
VVLESQKSGVVLLGPAHVKLDCAARLGGGYGSPQQPWHRSEPVEFSVGASVLVVDDFLAMQNQNGGNRRIRLICHPKFRGFTGMPDEVSKPPVRRRKEPMSAPGFYKQRVKVSKQIICLATFLDKTGPLSSSDTTLDRVFVKAV